ncbi:MAG: hypothetical protein IT283_05990 [Bacteroidetes bacterium]|jgi:hypothetical protein|nr:hypothetical protein [Bacteroidota bacterium]
MPQNYAFTHILQIFRQYAHTTCSIGAWQSEGDTRKIFVQIGGKFRNLRAAVIFTVIAFCSLRIFCATLKRMDILLTME